MQLNKFPETSFMCLCHIVRKAACRKLTQAKMIAQALAAYSFLRTITLASAVLEVNFFLAFHFML